jgi:hypothetical protein
VATQRLFYDNTFTPTANTATLIVPANPYRVTLILGTNNDNYLAWSTRNNQAGINDGIVLLKGIPLKLTKAEFGEGVTKPWYVYAGSATVVGWGEVVEVEVPAALDGPTPPVTQLPKTIPPDQPGFFRPGYAAPAPLSSRQEPVAFPTGPDIHLTPERLEDLPTTRDLRH